MIAAVFTQCVEFGKFNDEALKLCKQNSSENVQIILVDNGSPEPINSEYADVTIRIPKNMGANGIPLYLANQIVAAGNRFALATERLWQKYDIMCFFHADLMIVEKDWDLRVFNLFKADDKIVLAGFVGSTEMDSIGGRGMGTVTNFQGLQYSQGKGASWRDTGALNSGELYLACLDHCVMCFRSKFINQYEWFYSDPPPMDFEDKYISCETIDGGYKVGYVGIACDHISGAKGQCGPSFRKVCEEWLDRRGIIIEGDPAHQVYLESEKIFLKKWRDEEELIPFRV